MGSPVFKGGILVSRLSQSLDGFLINFTIAPDSDGKYEDKDV